ncbi:MAG: DUF29 domain-containing protein [Rhodospirillaceae bacterium]
MPYFTGEAFPPEATAMPVPASPYEADFYAWTQDQARRLREAAASCVNLPLDFENLAEEVESMGSEQALAIESALVRILEHLLKLEHSPAANPRAGWIETVDTQRDEVARRLRRNPALVRQLPEFVEAAWPAARKHARRGLARHDETAETIPPACPYTPNQALDEDWWPVNRHGLE